MVVRMDLRNLAIPNIKAVTGRIFVDEISDGKFIATLEYIEDFDLRAEKSFCVFSDQIQIRLSAPDGPIRAPMNKVLRELEPGKIFVTECIKPRLNDLSAHKQPPIDVTVRSARGLVLSPHLFDRPDDVIRRGLRILPFFLESDHLQTAVVKFLSQLYIMRVRIG